MTAIGEWTAVRREAHSAKLDESINSCTTPKPCVIAADLAAQLVVKDPRTSYTFAGTVSEAGNLNRGSKNVFQAVSSLQQGLPAEVTLSRRLNKTLLGASTAEQTE